MSNRKFIWISLALIVWIEFCLLVTYGNLHITWKATDDQLYGCITINQTPSGECK
jgi:hypothetical protein